MTTKALPECYKDGFITPHFNISEFTCKGSDCCGNVSPVSLELIFRLQDLRDHLNRPLIISSGFRCRPHNHNVGGSPTSLHMFGMAADILLPKGMQAAEFYTVANTFTFARCYFYYWGVHVDVRPW
jgi:zinc D-Ala-D-Ala carboxypeptidase